MMGGVWYGPSRGNGVGRMRYPSYSTGSSSAGAAALPNSRANNPLNIDAMVSSQISAAVDMQDLAGHEAGLVRSEEHGGAGDVVGLGDAAERDRAGGGADLLLAAAIAPLGGVGQPLRDRVDPAAV